MIHRYLTQTATLHRTTGVGADGSRISEAVTIPCRFQRRTRLFTNRKGEQAVSVAQVFTTTPVSVDDTIEYEGRRYPVGYVAEIRAVSGAVSHYEVLL